MNNSWDTSSYQRIKDVKLTGDIFQVKFENGDIVEFDKTSIIPYQVDFIDWTNFSKNDFELIIPAKPDDIIVPWDKIRVFTDVDFAKHLVQKAEEQAKLIGVKIKTLREKKNIKSSELAERSGLTPQTISRIEKGHTDVGFATLRKILAAMGYSLKDLANEDAILEAKKSYKDYKSLAHRLYRSGIDNNLLAKIIPKQIIDSIDENQSIPDLSLNEIGSYISKVFGWTTDEIWSNEDLKIKSNIARAALFKTPSKVNINQIVAYSHYAYYLARIVVKIYNPKTIEEYPSSIEEFNLHYHKKYEHISFENLLNFVWDLGIIVLPLNDSGVFHGASWNIDGKHAIILKQNSDSHARWCFDLLHEVYHVFAHLEIANSSIIETEELTPFISNESTEELEANAFANQVVFSNRSEELAMQCIQDANFKLENLKHAVLRISEVEKVPVDFLANYLAFRLQLQGQNWWGTASNLQITNPSPFQISVKILRERILIDNLNPIDYNLLNIAITI